MTILRTALFVLIGALVAPAAGAEGPSPLPEWEYAAGIALLPSLANAPARWDVSAGLNVEYLPRYDGATQYHFMADPIIDVRYYDLAFLSTVEGLGVNLLHSKTARAGVALTYDFGRSRDGGTPAAQLHEVHGAPEAKLFAEYVIFPVVIRADLRRGFGGHGGWIGDVGVYTPVIGQGPLQVFLGPSVTLADRHYLRSYFGVTAADSAESGLPEYDAGGGPKSASFGANAIWFFASDWFVDGVAAVDRLLGAAGRSPVTQQRTQAVAGLTLGYTF